MTRRIHASHRYPVAILFSVLIGGCATPLGSPTAPSLSSHGDGSPAATAATVGGMNNGASGQFYPLQIGNQWDYRKRVVSTVVPYEGDPPSLFEQDATIHRELVCVENRDGRDYVVEQIDEQAPYQTSPSWIRYRQDRTGLYEADVSLQEPGACGPAAGGRESGGLASRLYALIPAGSPERQAAFRTAIDRLQAKLARVEAALHRPSLTDGATLAAAGELTRLRYPLYPAAAWTIRGESQGGRFVARVEGTDLLDLPAGHLPGFRIRVLSTYFGPDDVVRVWYGPSGLLQLATHMESEARDDAGRFYGRIIVDQSERLESVTLVREPFAGTLFEEGLPRSR